MMEHLDFFHCVNSEKRFIIMDTKVNFMWNIIRCWHMYWGIIWIYFILYTRDFISVIRIYKNKNVFRSFKWMLGLVTPYGNRDLGHH